MRWLRQFVVLVSAVVTLPLAIAPPAQGQLPASSGAAADYGGPAVVLSPRGLDRPVCADTPLRLTFKEPPQLGTAGRLQVHRADGTLVDTVDLADPASRQRAIGGALSDYGEVHRWTYEPVVVEGRTASVHLHQALAPGEVYHVTVEEGFFLGMTAVEGGTWRFRTQDAPRRSAPRITVDRSGGADFCTVQGAVDSVPENNSTSVRIDVAPGTYREIVYVAQNKPHLTVRGSGASRTVIGYPNNSVLNGDAAMANVPPEQSYCPRRVLPQPDRFNCWRAAFGVDADDFRLEHATIHNSTPDGGSQAEAFRGNGDRIVLDHVRVLSHQDSLRLQGRAFVTDSYVEGDVDFVWGTGGVFVQDSELRSLDIGYIAQIRNQDGWPGNVFLRTRLTRADTVPDGSVLLGRIDKRFPTSQVVFLDSTMDAHVAPVGWGISDGDCTTVDRLRFWEYGSTTPDGAPVDTSGRLACSRQLDAAEAEVWRDPAQLLDGWDPRRPAV
ncbi:pectinesterase family protein [Streptomyces pathocidini]|uniref:Pectinesterase family protein n=1 Tax=Streptomyces pathocidini TaxID=1650571 RepID=A0ABW7UX39_9ACTN|nr:pectinesterase family protein [Streptomyces pathocidini]